MYLYLLASLLLSYSVYASDEQSEGTNKPLVSSSSGVPASEKDESSTLNTPSSIFLHDAQKEAEPDESIFNVPEGVVGLSTSFGLLQEHEEILTPEQQEERAKKVTLKFKAEKKRRTILAKDEDCFVSFLSRNKLPITYFTGLSIDGGGTRGLISALLLEELSRRLSRPLHNYFDYIGGTSIGGILALGLTAPDLSEADKPLLHPSELAKLFTVRGNDIFPNKPTEIPFYNLPLKLWDSLKYLMETAKTTIVSQYDPHNLVILLKEKLGEKTYLHQTLTNTLITAVDTGQQRPQTYLFDSQEARKLYSLQQAQIPLWEVGRSTSAAPTYFPAYKLVIEGDGRILNQHRLVDGGLWVNNPSSLVARSLLKWASEQHMFASHKNIILLSLGTGYSKEGRQIPGDAGLATAVRPVIDTLMNVSSFAVHETLRDILSRDNYLRINPQLQEELKLDTTDQTSFEIFEKAAKSEYEKVHTFIDGPFRKVLEADEFLPRVPRILDEVSDNSKGKEKEQDI
ncbi:MAG: patatin-like phospholipase family protein [Alphaproteobacteria bacterium]|nr:patatin-like phospholipase family protein [Alphaproteobacteria bacterium]